MKNKSTALQFEILFGIIGLPGTGWIYSGYKIPGAILLVCYVVLKISMVVSGSLLDAALTGFVVTAVSAALLDDHYKREFFASFDVAAVEEMKSKKDVGGLVAALASLQDGDTREAVIDALGTIGDAKAIGPLITRLLHSTQQKTRKAAAKALVNIYRSANTNALQKRLIFDQRSMILSANHLDIANEGHVDTRSHTDTRAGSGHQDSESAGGYGTPHHDQIVSYPHEDRNSHRDRGSHVDQNELGNDPFPL